MPSRNSSLMILTDDFMIFYLLSLQTYQLIYPEKFRIPFTLSATFLSQMARGRKGRIALPTYKTRKQYIDELKQVRLENRELRQKQDVYKAQLRRLYALRDATPRRAARGSGLHVSLTFPCTTLGCNRRTVVRATLCPACEEKEREEEGDEADEESSEPGEDDPSDCEPPAPAPPLALIAAC
jgi:hypothetical protein